MKKKEKFINEGETINELIYNTIEKYPANNAFKVKVNGEIQGITYLQMKNDMESLGTEFASRGFDGKRMGLIGENSYEWYNCFLSIVCGGNVAVPFDKGFTAEELANCIDRSNVKVLFYDEKHAALVETVKPHCADDIEYVLIRGEGSELESMRIAGSVKMTAGDRSFSDRVIMPQDLAALLFTSGTTSMSKIVMLTQGNIASNVTDMLKQDFFWTDDVNMAFLPFHHTFGLVGCLVFLASACCNVFCDGLKYITKNFEEYGVTVFVGVPLIVESLYNRIMRQIEKQGMTAKVQKGLKLSAALRKVGIDRRRQIFSEIIDKLGGKLRFIICGAAPLSKEVSIGLNNFGIVVVQGYGLTETSPVLAAERPNILYPGSVGIPMKRVKIYIEDPDENGIGEIVVWGPNVMKGYLDQPEATAEVLKDGWFHTGDLGRLDGNGVLWICGRKKNVIVMKNGKNIFPEEIESLIDGLPYVAENLIFTREKHNELVLWCKIVYNEETAAEAGFTEEALAARVIKDLEAINATLPVYKQINHFILSGEPMIKTTTQKVKRAPELEKINAQWADTVCYTVKEQKNR